MRRSRSRGRGPVPARGRRVRRVRRSVRVHGAGRCAGPARTQSRRLRETVYGLDGALAWTVEDLKVDVGPGDVLCLPRGVVHRFDDEHDAARTLAIVTPDVLRPDYFREMAAVVEAARSPRARLSQVRSPR